MRIYHRRGNTPYHFENSLRGVRYAAAHGYDAIDLDLQMTQDGVIVVTHWGQPMLRDGFRDPLLPLANRRRQVRHMRWARVRRLRVPRGKYRIQRLEVLLAECARLGITAVLEPKGDQRFRQPGTWMRIRVMQKTTGAAIKVYALPELGGEASVAAATAAKFHAWVIER